MPKSRGGRRLGAGRPKGSKSTKTKQQEAVAAAVAQVAHAQAVAAVADAVHVATVTQADLIDKESARVALRALVLEKLRPMAEAQIANAMGLKYLVTRQKKTGKFIRVTEAMAKVKLGDDEEIIEVWEKDPSVQAFTDLLNRALDKPAEQVQEIKLTGEFDLVTRLQNARKRAATAAH